MDKLGLERREKALDDGVVVAVALAAHAADDAELAHRALIIPARILAASIRMMNQAARRATSVDGHHQRLKHEVPVDARARRPANNASRMKIEHDCQIEPALQGSN